MRDTTNYRRIPVLDPSIQNTVAPRGTHHRWPVFFLLLIGILVGSAFFKPYLNLNDFDSINVKAHFFYLAPALFILFFFGYAVVGKLTIRLSRIDLLLIGYALYLIINYAVRGFPYNEHLANLTLTVFTLILLKQFFYDSRFGSYVQYGCFLILLLLGLYEVAYGEIQLLGFRSSHHNLFRITGSFHNPGPYAIFLSPIFIFSLAVVIFPPNYPVLARSLVILSWITLVGIAVILPATQSRTAWIGVLIGSFFVFYARHKTAIHRFYNNANTFARSLFFLAVAVFISLTTYLLYLYKPESADGRTLIWRIGSASLSTDRLFGDGFEQFRANFGDLQSEFMIRHMNEPAVIERADYVPFAFNDFLQLFIENGLLGLGLLLAILFFAFRTGFRSIDQKSPFLIGSTGALLSLGLAAFFSYPFEMPIIWLLFLFFISILSYSSEKTIRIRADQKPLLHLLALVMTVSMVMVLKNQIYLIKVKADWKQARQLLSRQLYPQAVAAYQAAYLESPDRPEVMLGYGKALYMVGDFSRSAAMLEKASTRIADPILYTNLGNAYARLKRYDQAETAYRKAISIIPNKLYPRYLLANLYVETGDWKEARKTARFMVKMPVPISSPASRQITREMNQLLKNH